MAGAIRRHRLRDGGEARRRQYLPLPRRSHAVGRGLPRKSCGSRYIPTYPVLCVGVLADEKHSGRRQTWTNAAPAVRRSYAVAAVKSTRIPAFCRVCFCCQGCRACRPFRPVLCRNLFEADRDGFLAVVKRLADRLGDFIGKLLLLLFGFPGPEFHNHMRHCLLLP